MNNLSGFANKCLGILLLVLTIDAVLFMALLLREVIRVLQSG